MAKAPTTIVPALKYLIAPEKPLTGPLCAISGDDAFLRHEVRTALVRQLSRCDQDDGEQLGCESFDGRAADMAKVLDALRERSLFGAKRRIVVVEEADTMVKRYREKFEKYLEKPIADAVLVLEVKTWPANTRLAKAVAKSGLTIRCQVPTQGRELTEFTKQLKDWLIHVAHIQHEVELKRPAVDLLLEQLPTEVGILCQEVAKLSLLTAEEGAIDAAGSQTCGQLASAQDLGHDRRGCRRSRCRGSRSARPSACGRGRTTCIATANGIDVSSFCCGGTLLRKSRVEASTDFAPRCASTKWNATL